MKNRLLHHTPGACSRVALNALEEIGLPDREQGVALMQGANRQPQYLAMNPKGKVPVLVEDSLVITELPVIVHHLATAEPQAHLLPVGRDGQVLLASLSDLIWLAGALHPLANLMMRPTALSTIDAEGVKASAHAQLSAHAGRLSNELSTRTWWYGDAWSMTDVLLAWVFATAGQCGFSYADFGPLAAHRERVQARPSFIRAREVELAVLERDGLSLPPGFTL